MSAELASPLPVAELPVSTPHPVSKSAGRAWSAVWPKLGAILLTVAVWQLVVWSGWRPQSQLPGLWPVLERLAGDLGRVDFYAGMGLTMRRAALGYAIAAGVAIVVAILIARIELARRSVWSLLVGLQSMPSLSCFPLPLLLPQHNKGPTTF